MIQDINLQNRDTHIIYWDDENQLFPRTDLFPDTEVFPEGIDEVGHIVSGSMRLNEIISDSELRFGELFSSKFEVQVFDMPDITNKYLQVYQFDNGEYKGIFSGKVISCKQDNSGIDRTIVAYDMSYVLREKDVSDWWLQFWENRGTSTIKTCRESLLDYMDIVYEDVTLVNDSITIRKNINATYLAFDTVLSMLCELNGCFPHFNRDDVLEFIELSPSNPIDLTELYEGLNSSFEDYVTDTISGVEFYDSEGELKFVVGDLSNTYKLSSNIFCYDMSSSELRQVGNNLLTKISNISYTPVNIKMIVGDLKYKLGMRIHTPKGDSYILENQYSSAQLVEQTIIANGEKKLGESSKKLTDEMLILNEKYSRLTFNIEEFRTEFLDYQTETESKFEQTSQQITLEVARGTKDYKATYQGDYVPTKNNYPANEWTTENEQAKNVGATFYNTAEGRTYRWTNAYNAVAITFDTRCSFDSATTLNIYVANDNNRFRMIRPSLLYSDAIAGTTIYIPNSTFYLEWSNLNLSGVSNKYGFSVASILPSYNDTYTQVSATDVTNNVINKMNTYGVTELRGTSQKPESDHNPYTRNGTVQLWKCVTGLPVSSDNKYAWIPQEGYAYSRIEQTADMIRSEVSAREYSDNNIYTDLKSKIEQTASKIDMKVSKGSISSELSLEPDKIHLKGGRLIIETGNFQLNEAGTATMTNANVHGEIHCGNNSNGKIDIANNRIKGNNDSYIDFAGNVGNSRGIHFNSREAVFSTSSIGVTRNRNDTTVMYGQTGTCWVTHGNSDVWYQLSFIHGICISGLQ